MIIKTILVAVALLALSGVSPVFAQTTKTETTSNTKWEWSDDGWRRRVELRGKVEFNDQYSDVISISENGSLRLEEDHRGESLRLDVRPGADGGLVRKYLVNGEARDLDDRGRRWMAELLLLAVRQGAIDVDKRVQTLLKQRGVKGTMQEIASIKGDYGRRIYFQSLLKSGAVGRSDLAGVLDAARMQISSDHDKANLLKATTDVFLTDASPRDSYFRAVIDIRSDYERRGVMMNVLKRKNLSEPVLSKLLEAAGSLSSDYEKATFLLSASDFYTADPNLRDAFLGVVETIKSDHERGRVLNEMLKKKQIGRR